MQRDAPVPASLAGGRYVLGERLGSGATSIVVEAADTRLGVRRAIKLLRPLDGFDPAEVSRRLRSEAMAMARVAHPNVVTVHDIAVEGPFEYIVMDVAPGGSLWDRVYDTGPLPSAIVASMMIDVLSALACAHARGIVHRDVKPGNILLDDSDRPLLGDFGIAMLADLRRTQTGQGLGSLGFMSPQQRLDASSVTHHADIYAAGATIYFLCTSRNPADLFLADADSERFDDVEPRLAAVIRRACAREPDDRYASAGELARALLELHPDGRSADEVRPGTPRFPDPAPPGRRPEWVGPEEPGTHPTLLPPRRWRLAAPLAGMAAGAVVAFAAFVLLARPSPAPRPTSAPDEPALTAPSPDPPAPTQVTEVTGVTAAPIVAEPPTARRLQPPALDLAAEPPMGTWRMFRNGVLFSLELRGDGDDVRGRVRSTMGEARQVAVQVTGRYDAGARRLLLTEADEQTHYDITLDPDLTVGRGTVYSGGLVRSLKLTRTDGAAGP